MTGTVAYILARKIALGAVSGIKNLSFSGNQIIFNFNDGSSATMTIPLPKDGKDGLSIVTVAIDNNKHLICTMSDGSLIDAGELPGGTGGGLIQVKNKADLPAAGAEDTLYLTKSDDILYYWDDKDKKYRPVTGGAGANGIDFKTSNIEFDGIETTFDLPIDDKKVSIFINGVYLTENEDYTIDRTTTPNTVTFLETWEDTDLCTVVWVNGTVDQSGNSTAIGISQLKTDVKEIINAFAYILDSDIANPWPTVLTLDGSRMQNITSKEQKELVKAPYVINKDNKIIGCGFVTAYDNTKDEFTIVLTKYGEGEINNASLATTADIDKLFSNLGDIDISNPTLATKEDIDKLFNNLGDIDISSEDIYAKETDIDKLFGNIGDIDTSTGDIYAKKEDIASLFNSSGEINPDTSSLATKQDIDKLFN